MMWAIYVETGEAMWISQDKAGLEKLCLELQGKIPGRIFNVSTYGG